MNNELNENKLKEKDDLLFKIKSSTIEETPNNIKDYISTLDDNLNEINIKKSKYFDKIYLKNLYLIYKLDENIQKKDKKLNNQLEKFTKEITLQHLEVKKKFRLNEIKSELKYSQSIEYFKNIENFFTSDEKIHCIENSISEITNEVKKFYKDKENIKESDIIVGADDM
jgi:hypothetical protein